MLTNSPTMTRRQVESLSLVAKLLATEDIKVRHSAKAATASFETKSRTLTLPVWKSMDGNLYDMLVAHEVGHALFTPKGDAWVKQLTDLVGEKGFNRLKQYVNAVEDVRIERMMKDRYGGLRSVFAKAYRELTVTNPKLLALDEDISALPLIDRVNIHYKVGFAVDVPFSAAELPIVKRVAETKTWDEVVALAKEIYDLSKQQQEEKQQQGEDATPSNGSKGEEQDGEEQDGNSQDEQDRGENAEEGEENDDASASTEGGEESEGNESAADEKTEEKTEEKTKGKPQQGKESKEDSAPATEVNDEVEAEESKTEKAIEELSKKNLENGYDAQRNSSTTVTLPKFTDAGILPFAEILPDLKLMAERGDGFSLYQKFLAKNKSSVAALVQEFMRRKAADEAQRTRTADTGNIDPTRLWAYRVSDEIFGSYEIKREGKNHGIVFLLDWSGSMHPILKETVEQLGCMVQFCQSAGIPCEVYAFSNNHSLLNNNSWSKESGTLVPDGVRLLNFLSSSASPAQLKTALAGLLAWSNGGRAYGANIFGKNEKGELLETKYYLNGTPLMAATVAMNTMIPAFKQKTGVQVVNVCVLTDGDATDNMHYVNDGEGNCHGMHNEKDSTSWSHDFMKVNLQGKKAVVEIASRDIPALNRFLRVEHDCNMIAFRIDTSRSLTGMMRYLKIDENTAESAKIKKIGGEAYLKEKTKFLRENGWVSGNEWFGYTEWFGISSLKQDEADYFSGVNEDSTKTQLAKALSAEIGKTKSNRPLMARIAQRVSVKESK